MAMAVATRQRLSEVNPDGAKYFMEKLLFQIYEHFDEQQLTDVTFKLTNPTACVTAHRLILSAASQYFRDFFKTEQGICSLIEVNDIDSDTFQHLITYCYTGKTLITMDNVERMFKAALILRLDVVIDQCVGFLLRNINKYGLERLYVLESETQCEMLKQKILEYELGKFSKVVQSAEFLNFDANKLRKLLESDDLPVLCEKIAFEAVKRWYEHDAPARTPQLPDLISALRLAQLDTNFIMTNIRQLPGCHDLAMEAISWINSPLTRTTISLRFPNPRTVQSEFEATIKTTTLLAVNLQQDWDTATVFEYNQTEDRWLELCHTDMDDVVYFPIILRNDNLIFVGGNRNDFAIREVSSWNIKTKDFKRLRSMQQERYFHCLALLNDKIYVIGGINIGERVVKSVEVLSAANRWRSVSDMTTPRAHAGAIAFNGKIYVFGGSSDDRDCLKTVECYDPKRNNWTQCADMNEPRSCPGVAVHKGEIYVVGGCNKEFLRTAERYNAESNLWTEICSLNYGVEATHPISIYNQLWIAGSYESTRVSVYDDQTDEWLEKNALPSEGSHYLFAVPKTLLENSVQM